MNQPAPRLEHSKDPARRLWLRGAAVLAIYLALASVYAYPLLERHGSAIDGGDPVLNAAILWWNATTLPFSEQWWNPPFFYPSGDVAAFTENLIGISALASPIYWLTGNPLTTYNLALFLTWPLSAFAAYLLVIFLTRRQDAAFLAGLAYGFSPYRSAELGHLQMVSSYWMPIALLGLHGYLARRRTGWLVLFGIAWLLQSLANGYLMLFGGVLIGLWLLYFCSTRETWRRGQAIVAAWSVASLPLVPIMWKYRTVHEYYGMRRDLTEPLGYSYPLRAWFEVSDLVWLWHWVFPNSSDNLFPGATAVTLVLLAVVVGWRRRTRGNGTVPYRRARIALALMCGLSLVAAVYTLFVGPWQVQIAGAVVRMSVLNRAFGVMILSGIPLLLLTPRALTALKRRDALVFYGAATIAMAVFSCGPLLRVGDSILFDPAPYRWLMALPGFTELRVPTRFWMLGILCLAVAAGLSFARLSRPRGRLSVAPFAVAAAGFLLDGWLSDIPMAAPPERSVAMESAGPASPLLELPLGPDWDAPATFRSIGHRRRVVNGVSGYDPAHYAPLQSGLNDHDPAMLEAIASFGSFDVVVNGAEDPGGEWARYVSGIPGVMPLAEDGAHTIYRVPAVRVTEPVLGDPLPIARVQAFRHDASVIADGRIETEWGDDPQRPDQWVVVDLGEVREVGGVTHALGEYARDYPRRLAIELSVDGTSWQRVWEGPTAAPAFRAAVIGPREAVLRFAFPHQPARLVRLRQLAEHQNMWRIAEVRIHAPAER